MSKLMKTRDDLDPKELRKQARERFAIANRLEAEYLRALRMLTRQIDHMVKSMPGRPRELQKMLQDYAKTIEPWARSVAEKMLLRLARKDESAWIQLGRHIGRELRKEINEAPTGEMLRKFLDEQVVLITSLPLEAAQRVHTLSLEALITSTRAKEIAAEIMKTGKVTESRARLIARTEVARVASGLTLARSAHVGVTHYTWCTSGDMDVRESHQKMNGKVIPIDQPPEVEPGKHYHPGQFPNCRCWPSPIFSDED
jgi:SPP1 gp7 family putative phage head morphogenesis protein